MKYQKPDKIRPAQNPTLCPQKAQVTFILKQFKHIRKTKKNKIKWMKMYPRITEYPAMIRQFMKLNSKLRSKRLLKLASIPGYGFKDGVLCLKGLKQKNPFLEDFKKMLMRKDIGPEVFKQQTSYVREVLSLIDPQAIRCYFTHQKHPDLNGENEHYNKNIKPQNVELNIQRLLKFWRQLIGDEQINEEQDDEQDEEKDEEKDGKSIANNTQKVVDEKIICERFPPQTAQQQQHNEQSNRDHHSHSFQFSSQSDDYKSLGSQLFNRQSKSEEQLHSWFQFQRMVQEDHRRCDKLSELLENIQNERNVDWSISGEEEDKFGVTMSKRQSFELNGEHFKLQRSKSNKSLCQKKTKK